MCETYLINENYENAEKYGNEGLEICRINNDLEQECKILGLMIRVFEKTLNNDELEETKLRYREIFCQ